jgi:hypothetical protein
MPASPGYCRWNGRFGQESLQAKQSLTRLHVAHEVYYWAYFAEYFSPWKNPASPGEEVEGTGMTLEEMLDELAIEEKEIACVPETFQVPPHQIAAVECQQMVVRLDSIVFMAIPKHASFYVQTVELPLAMIEAAAATKTSPAHV